MINGRGVTAVSYSMLRRYVYTTGVDGMVCQIDTSTGSTLGRFRAFTKPISSVSVSAGKVLYIEAECFWFVYPGFSYGFILVCMFIIDWGRSCIASKNMILCCGTDVILS